MAERPEVGLLHQRVPCVVVRGADMPIVLIARHLSQWSVVSDNECSPREWPAQLQAKKLPCRVVLGNKVGRPQAPIIRVGSDHVEVVHHPAAGHGCGDRIARRRKIRPCGTHQESHIPKDPRLVFKHVNVRGRCRSHLLDCSIDMPFVALMISSAVHDWSFEGLICPQNTPRLQIDVAGEHHHIHRHIWGDEAVEFVVQV